MILTTLLLMNLLWISYSLTEGIREGFYWHYENKCKRNCDFDVNPMFHLQRILVLILTGGFMVHTLGWYSLFSLTCITLTFPFFHNGSYYYTRHKLENSLYNKRWKDESKTFPPLSVLTTYNKRVITMLIGILAQVFVYLFLLN